MNVLHHKRQGLAMLAICSSVLATPVLGQIVAVQPPTALKRMSVDELLSVRVLSLSRRPEELREAPGNIHLITNDAVRASGASSLPQVLRLSPSLFVAQGSSYDWAIGARGFTRPNTRVNKMQVLIDGRTVYSPLFSGVFWDSEDVFLPDLDRVEVITGPAGVSWGANAVNGVVNITTRSARATQGGVLYAGFGDALERHFGLRYGDRVNPHTHYRVYVKHRAYDDTLPANGFDRDAWDFTQGGFRVDGGDARTALEWTVQGDVYRGNYRQTTGPAARNEGANLLARWQAHLTSDSSAALRIYHDYTKRDAPGVVFEYLRTTEVDFQHQLRSRGGHQLVWGANYRYMNEAVHFAPGQPFAFLPAEKNLGLGGVFAQGTYAVVPHKLQLIGGVRVEHNNYSGWEIQPTLRLAWNARPRQLIWAAVSQATRTPSRIDADFFFGAAPNYIVAGGPDFDSEELTAIEAGWRGQISRRLSGSVTLYRHDYDKLRSLSFATFPGVIENGLRGRSHGVEAFFDWQVTDGWRLRPGGFLLDEKTWLRPGAMDAEAGRGESSNPGYQFYLRSGFDLGPNVILWCSLRTVDDVPSYANGQSNGAIPDYTELDVTLHWRMRPHVEWVVTGRNLLHPSHVEIGEAPMLRNEIERSFHTMIRWDF